LIPTLLIARARALSSRRKEKQMSSHKAFFRTKLILFATLALGFRPKALALRFEFPSANSQIYIFEVSDYVNLAEEPSFIDSDMHWYPEIHSLTRNKSFAVYAPGEIYSPTPSWWTLNQERYWFPSGAGGSYRMAGRSPAFCFPGSKAGVELTGKLQYWASPSDSSRNATLELSVFGVEAGSNALIGESQFLSLPDQSNSASHSLTLDRDYRTICYAFRPKGTLWKDDNFFSEFSNLYLGEFSATFRFPE
jgi:hypothetical protein